MSEVAVIIPVHNSAATIVRCIKSLYSNDTELLVIVVDDFSTDKSALIARQASEKCTKSNIKFVFTRHDRNRGPQEARNNGTQIALRHNCKYITFLDSDDTLSCRAIDKCLKIAKSTDADIVQMKIDYIITKLHIPWSKKNLYDTSKALDAVLYNEDFFPVQAWGKLYKADFLKFASPLSSSEQLFWGEDRLFNIPIFDSNPKIIVLKKAQYNYFWCGSTKKSAKDKNLTEYNRVAKLKRNYALSRNLAHFIPLIDNELKKLTLYHAKRLINQGMIKKAIKCTDVETVDALKLSPKRIFSKFVVKILST